MFLSNIAGVGDYACHETMFRRLGRLMITLYLPVARMVWELHRGLKPVSRPLIWQ
jgi:hypothetical protein